MEFTKDPSTHPTHGPLTEERLIRVREWLQSSLAYSEGSNRDYMMADAAKAIDELLELREAGQEPVADIVAWHHPTEERTCDIRLRRHDLASGPLYAAPQLPQPAELPDECPHELVDFCERVIDSRIAANAKAEELWEACRAAMLQGAEPAQGWIPCSERMPGKLIPVMVMYEDGEMWSAIWTGTKWDDGTEFPDPHAVTHWQEMPAAPQQEAE